MIGFSYQNKAIEIKQSGSYHFTVAFHSEREYGTHIFIMSKLDADDNWMPTENDGGIHEASCKLSKKMSSTCSTTIKVNSLLVISYDSYVEINFNFHSGDSWTKGLG